MKERNKLAVDPLVIIKALEIEDYSVDDSKKAVYVSEPSLERIAEYMDFKLPDGCTGFSKGGWWWLVHEDKGRFPQA